MMIILIITLLAWAVGATVIVVGQSIRMDEMAEVASDVRRQLEQLSAEHSQLSADYSQSCDSYEDRIRSLRLDCRKRLDTIQNALTEPIE